MKKNILVSIIKKRKITICILIMLILLGIYNYNISPKQEAPKIDVRAAIITVVYPGATPNDMEKIVTSKIEEVLSEIEGYDYCISTSKNGMANVIVEFKYDVDKDKTMDELKKNVYELENNLPEEVEIIDINTEFMKTAGIILSLNGKNEDELLKRIESIKEDLSDVDGITSLSILGDIKQEISIDVDINKLDKLPISMDDLINIIMANNIEIPSGKIKNKDELIMVKTNGKYIKKEDIEDIIVGAFPTDKNPIKIKDISKVSISNKKRETKYKYNNKDSLLLVGYFDKEKNVIEIGENIDKELKIIKRNLPKNMEFNKVIYQPEDVENSINNFINNLLLSMCFVIIVVFISLGFRNALIVSTTIPLTIFITFSVMNLLDINFHKISISALIISLGMLVDNAIVVSEIIKRKIDIGVERMKSCVDGIKEVAIPMLSSTLTTIVAFIPLLMLKSVVGDYIKSIPQIIIITLITSYIVALIVTPTMSFFLAKKSKNVNRISVFNKGFVYVLKVSLKFKLLVIFLIMGAIALGIVTFNELGLKFFPKADKDLVYINLTSENESNIEEVEELNDKVAKILNEQDEVIEYTSAIGIELPKFWDTMIMGQKSLDFGQILVKIDLDKTKKYINNTKFVEQLQDKFDKEIETGKVIIAELEEGEPVGAPVNIRISGNNITKLKNISDKYVEILKNIEGTSNIRTNYPENSDNYIIDFNNDKLSSLGINKIDVQKEINIVLMGKVATSIKSNGKEMDIYVKNNIDKIDDLKKMKVLTNKKEKIRLDEIADFKLVNTVSEINKYDGKYNISVYSDVKLGYNSADIERKLKDKLKNLESDGIKITYTGEQQSINKNFSDVGILSMFSVMAIFIVLLVQFSSYLQPVIILLSVPLSSIGSIIGLYLTREDLSFTALLGIVSLFGIVVNNAIILIDCINKERKNGKDINKACISAVEKRFRPILVTTITTIIGLLPLVFRGSELFSPMSISIISGLIFSTILTIIVVPVFYGFIESKIDFVNNFKN